VLGTVSIGRSGAEQPLAGDGLQRPLVPRSRFQPHLKRSVRPQIEKDAKAGIDFP
jgi:hypothetical protein